MQKIRKFGILVSLLFLLSLGGKVEAANHSTEFLSVPSSQYGIPPVLAGYEVLMVFTSQTTACIPNGIKRLVLRSTEQTLEDQVNNRNPQDIDEALIQSGILDRQNWDIQIVGPDLSLETILDENDKWNELSEGQDCVTLAPIAVGTDGTELKTASPANGYTVIENIEAGWYTDDNAQGVGLVAPSVGSNQNGYSFFLNNVLTNTNWFLQNGFAFRENFWGNGYGSVVWTDTGHGLAAQNYSIPYTAGHFYGFVISGNSGIWQLCAQDNDNPSTYTCIFSTGSSGTHLLANQNTGIFAENTNTNTGWNSLFSLSWQAFDAKICRNGICQSWSTQHRHTIDACASNWPVSSAISGSLISGASAYFHTSGLPLKC